MTMEKSEFYNMGGKEGLSTGPNFTFWRTERDSTFTPFGDQLSDFLMHTLYVYKQASGNAHSFLVTGWQ